tara:strand:+ start:72 stop:776 length:705 start_codon:yes stop_codon:yes gene_type:complete
MSEYHLHTHFSELHSVLRKTSVLLILFAAMWTTTSTSMINEWASSLSYANSGSGMAIYSPMDWVEVRWTLVLLLSALSALPIFSILLYRFMRPGLFREERKWIFTVLSCFSVIAPLASIAIWTVGVSTAFSLAESFGTISGVENRYDITQIVSLSIGITWIFLVSSITAISLSMSRLMLGSESDNTRFRIRILLISTGVLILTLPVVYDGLRIALSVAAVLFADISSKIVPVRR